jgi:thiol-disulfide isomerase/thioredoxin
MRKWLAVAALVGLMAPVLARDPKAKPDDKEKKDEKKELKVGDPAPALKVTKWLQGTEVKSFAPEKVYVVEFWATWCGPCIVMMPHMSDLQQEYKDKAVTFVGFSAKDNQGNNQEKVTAFVEKRGPKLKYTFAYADDRDTYDAWMKAANQSGIPCCFVVGKDGKIAFIGHPMYLDEILPKVVAGTWTKDDAEAMKKVEQEVNDVFKSFGGDGEAALKTLAEFEQKHPKLAHIPYFTGPKIGAMLKAKKTAEARKFAEEVMAKAIKSDDPGALQSVSMSLRSPAASGDKELLALSVKAAEAAVKVAGEKDAVALYYLAEAYFAAGDKDKAKDTGAKAIAAADSEQMKATLERLTKKYDEEKKDK